MAKVPEVIFNRFIERLILKGIPYIEQKNYGGQRLTRIQYLSAKDSKIMAEMVRNVDDTTTYYIDNYYL